MVTIEYSGVKIDVEFNYLSSIDQSVDVDDWPSPCVVGQSFSIGDVDIESLLDDEQIEEIEAMILEKCEAGEFYSPAEEMPGTLCA